MKRKIIQLIGLPFSIFGVSTSIRLYALCDDGTIWFRTTSDQPSCEWMQLKEQIPDRENET